MIRWILSRLSAASRAANEALKSYDLSTATSAIHQFWLYELCDVYLEAIKPIMNGTDADVKLAAQEALYVFA